SPSVIQAASRATKHLRLLVGDGRTVQGVVHVRDSVSAEPATTARDLMRSTLVLDSRTPVYEALRTMRETRGHLALVTSDDGAPAGLITLTDVLDRLMPQDQTPR
ncbi:MAG: CBS domain-containing protein, partial [Mycobacterium sp.]